MGGELAFMVTTKQEALRSWQTQDQPRLWWSRQVP
jgi:hypothetical protein